MSGCKGSKKKCAFRRQVDRLFFKWLSLTNIFFMKTKTFSILLEILICCGLPLRPVCGKKWIVTVKDFQFVPYNLTHVKAGDTIQWVWQGGYHSTTSLTIPMDADPWHGVISEDTSSFFYVPRQNGTYEYYSMPDTVHEMNGRFMVYGATGSGGTGEILNFRVFPNPCRDYFRLRMEISGTSCCEIMIYNLSGKLIKRLPGKNLGQSEGYTIPAGDLPRGLLIVKVVDASGNAGAVRVIHE